MDTFHLQGIFFFSWSLLSTERTAKLLNQVLGQLKVLYFVQISQKALITA